MAPQNMTQSDIAGMQAAVGAVQTAVDDLNAAIKSINGLVSGSQAFWQSQGAQSFQTLMLEDFEQQYVKMINDLLDIKMALDGSQSGYADAVATEKSIVGNRFSSILGS